MRSSGAGLLSTRAVAHDESCAAKLPVKISDANTIFLGKYDITAGRFRVVVEATNGDLQA